MPLIQAVPSVTEDLTRAAASVNHAHAENRDRLRLFRAVDLARNQLYRALYDFAREQPEWSTFLALPGVDRWAERLHGAAQVLAGAMELDVLGEDDLREVACYIADRHGRMSHHPVAQRRRAYQRAAAVRERNRERDAAIHRERDAGVSLRKIGARHGLSEGGVRKVLKHNSGKVRTCPRTLPVPDRLEMRGGVSAVGSRGRPQSVRGGASCSDRNVDQEPRIRYQAIDRNWPLDERPTARTDPGETSSGSRSPFVLSHVGHENWGQIVSFYRFPRAHWRHLRNEQRDRVAVRGFAPAY